MDIPLFKKHPDNENYIVSLNGMVYSKLRHFFLQPEKSEYLCVRISTPTQKKKRYPIHRLVALLFVVNPNPAKYKIVNHKDGNKYNNHYTNLEWCSYSENRLHALENGKGLPFKGKRSKVKCPEDFKPMFGFEDEYKISKKGEIYSIKAQIMNKPKIAGDGYYKICLNRNCKTYARSIHSLVLETFICPRPSKKHIGNHKNSNCLDNNVENLEWITYSENNYHSYDIGGLSGKKKSVVQIHASGEKTYFESIADAEKITGVGNRGISNVCLGWAKTAGGCKWEHLKNERNF